MFDLYLETTIAVDRSQIKEWDDMGFYWSHKEHVYIFHAFNAEIEAGACDDAVTNSS